jgi:hypothetical protein
MTPSKDEMSKAQESAYLQAKLDATFTSHRRNGATILRYKPGTLIKNSTGETYQVQANGSWKKLKDERDWLAKKR